MTGPSGDPAAVLDLDLGVVGKIVVPPQGRQAAVEFLRECAHRLREVRPDVADELLTATTALRTEAGASLAPLQEVVARREGPPWAAVTLLAGAIGRASADGPAAVRWLMAELDLTETKECDG